MVAVRSGVGSWGVPARGGELVRVGGIFSAGYEHIVAAEDSVTLNFLFGAV